MMWVRIRPGRCSQRAVLQATAAAAGVGVAVAAASACTGHRSAARQQHLAEVAPLGQHPCLADRMDGGERISLSHSMVQRVRCLLSEGRVILAAHLLDTAESELARDVNCGPADAIRARERLALEDSFAALAAAVQRQCARLERVRSSFAGDIGWTSRGSAYGFRVFTRGGAAFGELLSLRVEGNVDVPIFDLLALLHEVDLWSTWAPTLCGLGLRSASFVAEAGPLRKIVHVVVHLPWPFQDRALAVGAEVADCLDDLGDSPRQLIILLDSAEAYSHFPLECSQRIPTDEGRRRIDLDASAIVLTPLDGSDAARAAGRGSRGAASARTRLQALMSAKVDISIPRWLLNLATDTMSCLVLYCLCRQAAKISQLKAYQERLQQQDHRFYAVMRPRLAQFGAI